MVLRSVIIVCDLEKKVSGVKGFGTNEVQFLKKWYELTARTLVDTTSVSNSVKLIEHLEYYRGWRMNRTNDCFAVLCKLFQKLNALC